MLERRVGLVQDQAVDLKGAVGVLEGQSTAFAGSISALDARLSDQETKTEKLVKKEAPLRLQRSPQTKTSAAPSEVREALRQFDALTVK